MAKAVIRDGYVALVPYDSSTNTLDGTQIKYTALGGNAINISEMINRVELVVSQRSEDASTFGSGGWAAALGTIRSWRATLSGFASEEESTTLINAIRDMVLTGTGDNNNVVGLVTSNVTGKQASTASGNATIEIPKFRVLSGATGNAVLTDTADTKTFAGIGSIEGDLPVADRQFGSILGVSLTLTGIGPLGLIDFVGANTLTAASDDPGLGMDDNDTATIDVATQRITTTTVS